MLRFFERLRKWLPVRMRAEIWGSAVWMAAAGIFAAGDAIAYGLGGSLFKGGAISLGAVYLVVAYTVMLAAPIETIRTQLQDLQRADAGVARVRELMEIRSRLEDGTDIIPAGALAVEFSAVYFAYEDELPAEVRADEERVGTLEDLSFRLEPGRSLGLLGHTGSGKTTIARLLFRLYDAQRGEVCLGGINLRHAQIHALRAPVGDILILERGTIVEHGPR